MTENVVIENLQFVDPEKNSGATATFDLVDRGRGAIKRCVLRFDEHSEQYMILGPFPGAKSHKSLVTFAPEYVTEVIPLVLEAAQVEAQRIGVLFGGAA